MWRNVIANKYSSDGSGWCSGATKKPYGVSLWKYIRGGWERFSQNIRFEVGRGLRICFWDDLWCRGELSLKEAFFMLYRIARNKDVFMAEYLCWHNGIVH